MQDNTPETRTPSQGFIARQAVFDAARGIWGYEIYYRQNLDASAPTDHKALLEVATRAFLSPQWQHSPNSFLLVALDPQADVADVTDVLPRGWTVLKVSEKQLMSPGTPELLLTLRQKNYIIALGDFTGKLAGDPVLNLVDILAVDMHRANRDERVQAALRVKAQQPVQLLARKVEDQESFNIVKEAGFSLFEGFYFQKPEPMASKGVSSSMAGSLGILRMIEQAEPDLSELARTIQMDASLSFRLLKFLNSPYFGFAREVSSIKVALILAGWQQMRTWLRLVVFTEMAPRNKPNELVFQSAQRGRFLELVAQGAGSRRADSERLLLLGLFSLLDSIFDVPMPVLVGSLPLDQELKDTLCLKPTELLPWLELAHCFERADWTQLASRCAELEVDPEAVAASYTQSMQWAHAIFSNLG